MLLVASVCRRPNNIIAVGAKLIDIKSTVIRYLHGKYCHLWIKCLMKLNDGIKYTIIFYSRSALM